MFSKSILLIFITTLVAVSSIAVYGQSRDEQAVREIIVRWDAAYRALDAKTIAALETTDFEIVTRFGTWYSPASREENERMWAWLFTEIYKGKPGPKHAIDRIRFVTPDVAIVQTRGYRKESVTLSDGTIIPPFGQTVTFTVVRQKEGWRIAAQNIHNQFKDIDLDGIAPEKLPWKQKPTAAPKR
jgi:uncharacterized protein (TIGR02246 family)